MGSRIVKGHPWVFATEIGDDDGMYSAGDVVELYSYNGSFIGKGIVNPTSQIRIRLLTHNKDEEVDINFFLKKIKLAWSYRQKIGYTTTCRVVHGEADGLSGLIIDKYNSYIVIQILSLGMEQRLPIIKEAVEKIFLHNNIIVRNDSPIRRLEGLTVEQCNNIKQEVIMIENGIKFSINLRKEGQTGYYLDQSYNRTLIKHIVQQANVLDVFCHTGSFALHAAQYGAESVLGIDNNKMVIEKAQLNAQLNKMENKCTFREANAFDFLKQECNEDKKYDVVILDPPALAYNKAHIAKAKAAYKEINLRAMKLLQDGGFLVTTSRSGLLSTEMFKEILRSCANDNEQKIRQVLAESQASDHSIDWQIPTTEYLKFFIIQVY